MDSFHPTLSAGDFHSEAFGGTGCVNCRTEASLLGTLLGANCLNVCLSERRSPASSYGVWQSRGDFEEKAPLGALNLGNIHFPPCLSC